jgi:hypothetical protein
MFARPLMSGREKGGDGSCMCSVLLIHTGSKRGMISPSITSSKGLMRRSDLAFSLVTGVFLLRLGLLTRWRWRRTKTAPAPPRPHRGQRDPKPFDGYTRKPACELCESGVASHPQVPTAPPPRMILTRGRRRHLDTTGHFCRMPGVPTTAGWTGVISVPMVTPMGDAGDSGCV